LEQPTAAMFPLCSLIKSNGNRCGSPALKGTNFCFQHIGGNISGLTRARATSGANAKLKFVYPGDREAIQHNLFQIAQALSDGSIDIAMANAYNRLFRTCEVNLRRWETAKQTPSDSEKRMLPLPDEAPESTEQQSFTGQDFPHAPGAPSLPPATAAERACPELAEGACPELAEGACPELAEGACPELAEGVGENDPKSGGLAPDAPSSPPAMAAEGACPQPVEEMESATFCHHNPSEPELSPAERMRREYFGTLQPPC
jgi:hypothetical protein